MILATNSIPNGSIWP